MATAITELEFMLSGAPQSNKQRPRRTPYDIQKKEATL